MKTIDNIGDEEIQDVAIPTGIPIVYNFKKLSNGQLKSVTPKSQEHSVSQLHMKGQFLEKPGLLKVRKRDYLLRFGLVLPCVISWTCTLYRRQNDSLGF